MENNMFRIDVGVKKEFTSLPKYTKSTNKRNASIILLAEEYELQSGKSIYNLSYEEIEDLIITKYKNKTISSVESVVSVLRNYVDFCISKEMVAHYENRFTLLTANSMKKFVSKQSTINRIINWEQIKEFDKVIVNSMDYLILQLVFQSVRGRTKKGCTCEELRNLKYNKEDVDEVNNTLTLYKNDDSSRTINVRAETIELIKYVVECDEYLFNNGEERVRRSVTNIESTKLEKSEYVFRPINQNAPLGKVHELFFIQQIKKICKWTGANYLTLNNLYFSGMVEKVVDIFNKTGSEPTKEQYLTIVKEADFGETAELQFQYSHRLKRLAQPYLEKE